MQLPSVLMLLWPLTPLDWQSARIAWLLLNLGFTFGCLFLIARQFLARGGHRMIALIAALFMLSYPWRVVVASGQHLIAGMFFFLLSVELARRDRKVWAAVALACSLIKYTATAFLLPYFIWKRQWLPLAGALALHAALTAAAALWVGESPVQLVVQAIRAASFHQDSPGVYQASDGFIDLFALSRSLGLPLFVPVGAALAGTATTCWLAVRGRGSEALFLSLLCFWSFVAIYHRPYDAVILLIPLAIALRDWGVRPIASGLVLAVIAFSWIADRFVSQFTDWLASGSEGHYGLYYFVIASLYYGTLLGLLHALLRSGKDRDRRFAEAADPA